MRTHLSLLFLTCAATLLGGDSSETEFHNPTLVNLEGDPSNIVNESVNIVTGDFLESDVDLVIPGPEPISIERSHVSSNGKRSLIYHSWNLNHQGKLDLHGEKAYVTDQFGSQMKMRNEGKERNVRKYRIDKSSWLSWMTNSGSGEISGRTNPNNRNLYHNSAHTILRKGNGEEYYYKHRKDSEYFLDYILRPNGNQTSYVFDKNKKLVKIEAKNGQGEVFSSVDLVHPEGKDFRKNPRTEIYSSDGRKVLYHYEGSYGVYHITEVNRPNAPTVKYEYHSDLSKLIRKKLPDQRTLENEYYTTKVKSVDGVKIKKLEHGDPSLGRVMIQKAPVGTDSNPIITHRYFYDIKAKSVGDNGEKNILQGITTAYDALMNKTVYHHSKRHRLTQIEKFDKDELYSVEKVEWGDQNTREAVNLMSRTYEDANGNIQFSRNYTYDDYGNVIEDRLSGILTGREQNPMDECLVKTFVYSDDGKNHLLEENDGRKITKYDYYPRNNQIKKKCVISDGNTILRTFYDYDKNGTAILEIVDDGSENDINDLTNVTERHIKQVVPGTNGLPKIIEEKYLDLASGQECLLKKVINCFSIEGWLTKQEQYDSNGEYLCTLFWEYNKLGKVTKECDALGQETIRRYDANGNCIFEQGPRTDVHKEMAYDFSNRLIREEIIFSDGTNLSTHHKYDLCSNRIATIDPYGNETKYEYDSFGRCMKIIQPATPDEENQLVSSTKSVKFDLMSHPTLLIDERGGETHCTYTLQGKPIDKTYPDGSQEFFEYTLDGLLTKNVAKNGMITVYEYDALGRETQKEEYSSTGETLSSHETIYNAFHKLAEIDSEGAVTQYEYDGAGRLIRLIKGKKETEYHYDTLGREWKTLEWVNDYEALVKMQEYDLLDRIIEERTEDLSGNIYRRTQYEYDASGNQTHVWNDGQLTLTQYNPLGEVIQVTDAEGNSTRTHIQYDFLNDQEQRVKCTSTTDPLGNTSITQYDALGREESVIRKNIFGKKTQEREFHYDLKGNRVRSIDHVLAKNKEEREVVNAWEYDLCQREVKRIEAVGTKEQKVIQVAYNTFGQQEKVIKPDGVELYHTYDSKGRLETLRSTDDTVHYRYLYDSNDRPIQVYDAIHQTYSCKGYDGDQVVEETLGNGLTVHYEYDRMDRPLEICYPDGTGVRYRYRGPDIAKISRLIDGEETYSHTYDEYDNSGKLLQSTLIKKAGQVQMHYDTLGRLTGIDHPSWSEEEISYDEVGNILSSKANGTVRSFEHDDLYQLLSECGLFENTYEYDSLHNRTEKNGEENTVNALNQLVQDAFSEYRYDPNGNLLNFGEAVLTYDALDRISQVVTPVGEYHYRYDDSHRRISKTGPEGKVDYLYLGQNEIGSTNSEGEIQELRILGHGLGAEIGASVAIEVLGKCYAPLHDHIGNITCLLDPETGEVEAKYEYSAYGEEQVEGDLISWRFSSKRVDPETGLTYFGRRYYAPDLGRWITQDPAGFSAGINLYAYVNNGPLTHFDLYGLKSNGLWGYACKALTGLAGPVLQLLGDYVIAFPVVQDAFSMAGRALSGEGLGNYTPTWRRIPTHNDHTEGANGEVSDKVRVTFINGIMNCIDGAKEIAEYIAKTHGGVNVHFTHMNTYGLTSDLLMHLVRKLGGGAEPVQMLVQNFRDKIDEMGGVNGGGTIYHYAHSEGGLVTDLALKQLTPEERKMIHVVTLGSAKIIDLEGLGSTDNYISNRDYVPLFADPINYCKAMMGNMSNVHFLPSNNWNPIADHQVLKGNYLEVIQDRGRRFVKSYGEVI